MQPRPQLWLSVFAGLLIIAGGSDGFAQSTTPQLECTVNSSRKTRIEGGDYDDKTQRVSFDITLKNKSLSNATGPLNAVFYAFGESVHDRRAFKLLQKESFDFDLEARGSHNHATPQIELKFDTTGLSFGEKYRGWILQVHNGEGEMVFEQQSSGFINGTADFANLELGKFYNHKAEPIPEPKRR